jgi:hypothetical protein
LPVASTATDGAAGGGETRVVVIGIDGNDAAEADGSGVAEGTGIFKQGGIIYMLEPVTSQRINEVATPSI